MELATKIRFGISGYGISMYGYRCVEKVIIAGKKALTSVRRSQKKKVS